MGKQILNVIKLISLILLLSCNKEEIIMTPSKSSPVKLYSPEDTLFNEIDIYGIFDKCYCQIFNCGDTIKVHFQHTTGQTLTLNIFSPKNGIVDTVSVTEVSTGYYSASFVPESLSPTVCNQHIYLFVTGEGGETQLLTNSEFTSDLTSWTATGWSHDSSKAKFNFSPSSNSAIISQTFSTKSKGLYRLNYKYDFNDYGEGSYNAVYYINFYNGSSVVTTVTDTVLINPTSTLTFDQEIYIDGSFDKIEFIFSFIDELPESGTPVTIDLGDSGDLSNWVDLGSDWTIDSDPSVTLMPNQSASDLRSPYNTITEAEFGNIRTLTVDFDVTYGSSPGEVEITNDITDFGDFTTWNEVNDGTDFLGIIDLAFPIEWKILDDTNQDTNSLVNDDNGPIDYPTYGNLKKLTVDYFVRKQDAGTSGTLTFYAELWNNGVYVTEKSIQVSDYTTLLDNDSFDSDLSGWANEGRANGGGGEDWIWANNDTGTARQLWNDGVTRKSKGLIQNTPTIPSGTDLNILVAYDGPVTGETVTFDIIGKTGGVADIDSSELIDSQIFTADGFRFLEFNVNTANDYNGIGMQISVTGTSGLKFVDIYYFAVTNDPKTAIFNFDTTEWFDQVKLRWSRNGGTSSEVRPAILNPHLYYTQQFDKVQLNAELRNNASPITGGTDMQYDANSDGNHIAEFSYEVAGDQNNVAVQFSNTSFGVDTIVSINSVTLESEFNTVYLDLDYLRLYSQDTIAKSDCLDIKTAHSPSVLIGYSNDSNFDGIDYETSPITNYLRIGGYFHDQGTKEENETDETNNTTVSVYSKMEERMLLRIYHVPDFMHNLIKRVLMHFDVTIDGKNWAKKDEYEQEPPKRHLLSSSQIWLTDKDSIIRNVYS